MATKTAKRHGRPTNPDLIVRRHDEILSAAASLFAERGYAGTDIQVVADVIGVGKGTIYRYFPSKEQLFLTATELGMRRIREAVDAAIAHVVDPLDRIATAITAYLGFFDQHPEFAELLIQERAVFKDRKKSTYFEHREANIGRWRRLYSDLMADGRVRTMPVDRITNAISNLAYGTMFTNFLAGRTKPLAVQAGEIVDVVFLGILTDPERKRRQARTDSKRS